MNKMRRHEIRVTFSRPVSVREARLYLTDVMKVVEAFRALSKAAWEQDRKPVIERATIRRKPAP